MFPKVTSLFALIVLQLLPPGPQSVKAMWYMLLKIAQTPTENGGFPGGSVVTSPHATAGDAEDSGLIPGFERSLGGENGNPLWCSCLGNSMDRGVWQATVHRVAESQARLSTHTCRQKIVFSSLLIQIPLLQNPYQCLESQTGMDLSQQSTTRLYSNQLKDQHFVNRFINHV